VIGLFNSIERTNVFQVSYSVSFTLGLTIVMKRFKFLQK